MSATLKKQVLNPPLPHSPTPVMIGRKIWTLGFKNTYKKYGMKSVYQNMEGDACVRVEPFWLVYFELLINCFVPLLVVKHEIN